MAFQTNVLRGGEWVTETIDLKAVIKASTPAKPPRQRVLRPPKCGIITRTVVESPVANHILPVRLRSALHSDVAFVGDHFVHIRELRPDGQLQDVIHKNDFGDRIRNAKVIGSVPDDATTVGMRANIKSEDGEDIDMLNLDDPNPKSSGNPFDIAPQMLLVVLERGDCVFMVLRESQDGRLEFVTSQYEVPNMRAKYPGFSLAVDPSSRYVALSCFETLFLVLELESWEVMNERYRHGLNLRPVKTSRLRLVNGVISHMDFLFPPREDDYNIILMLVVAKVKVSRTVVYEWEAGEDLNAVFAHEKPGHRLPDNAKLPILLIPLTVKTTFFAVYEDKIVVGRDVLVGPPNLATFEITNPAPSVLHHQPKPPLWAAWTRPFRLPQWTSDKDNIYLAREDGVVMFLDIDSDNILGASQILKTLDCNISGAFCSLYDQFADILVVSGDSGPGAIWQLLPRQDPLKLGVIPNWHPTADFVTTDEFSRSDQVASTHGGRETPWSRRPRNVYSAPDRIFAASGRGVTGTVTEYRYGLQANIGLYFDCLPTTTHAWLVPVSPGCLGAGYYLIMTMPDKSTVFQLPDDLSEVTEPDSESVPFDLSSRTIAVARTLDDMIIQVTETCIVCASPDRSFRTVHPDLNPEDGTVVSHSDIIEDMIVLSRGGYDQSIVDLYRAGPDTPPASVVPSTHVEGEVTCVSFAIIGERRFVLLGLWKDSSPSLMRLPLDGIDAGLASPIPLDLGNYNQLSALPCLWTARPHLILISDVADMSGIGSVNSQPSPDSDGTGSIGTLIEAFTSIVCIKTSETCVAMVLGTRNGAVLTTFMSATGTDPSFRIEHYGLTAVTVSATSFCGRDSVFVCCDSALTLLTDLDAERKMSFKAKYRVWPVDAQDSSKPAHPIHSVTVLDSSFSDNPGHIPMLLAAGPQLLMAALLPHPQQVQRSISLHGTPLRMIYSHHLGCLVVAVERDRAPTLAFIDPDTGKDLARATDKERNPLPFISGLGTNGDSVHSIAEWVYQKDNNTWYYILVTTKNGQLLVVDTEKEQPLAADVNDNEGGPRLRYSTRFKRRCPDEIYSVVGHSNGLIYCTGTTIHWEILVDAEKKLELWKKFDLRSPATTLQVVNGKIVALTHDDSVFVINPTIDNMSSEMTLEHADIKARPAMHMIQLSGWEREREREREREAITTGGSDSGSGGGSSILLVSDRVNGLAGLWIPWQQPGRDCEVMFEAELPASVLKFRRGRTRPGWLQALRVPEYGVLPSTLDGAEILGICFNGSMQHVTLIGMEIWAVLRLVQNLAMASPLMYPFTYDRPTAAGRDSRHGSHVLPPLLKEDDDRDDCDDDYDAEPVEDESYEMQIDGDMLRRCLDKRCLRQIFAGPWGRARQRKRYVQRLAELLQEVEGGIWTAGLQGPEQDEERYFELVYDIMEYYLSPVM